MDLQKRTFLAMALSIFIILAYSSFVSKVYHVENKQVTKQNPVNKQTILPLESPPAPIVASTERQEKPKLLPSLVFETEKVRYEFASVGAVLLSAEFKDYQYRSPSFVLLADTQFSSLEFKPQVKTSAVVFTYKDQEKEITKEYSFTEPGYFVQLDIEYRNLIHSATNSYYNLNSEISPLAKNFDERLKEVALLLNSGNLLRNNMLRFKTGSIQELGKEVKWVGWRDKYFAYILQPLSSPAVSVQLNKSAKNTEEITVAFASQTLGPGQVRQDRFNFYCGPQIEDLLLRPGVGFEQIRNFGTFDVVTKLLLKGLTSLNRLVHNWGLAIIILTVGIYLCLYPLTLKQMQSMRKMQLHQPEIESLRQQYKDNPKKMNEEIMTLYKKHNMNPLGGCLPMILQIPVFFALFQALSRGIEVKGSHFLWVKDLSEPDRLFTVAGKDVNLLPILMTIAMFFQQKMSMSNVTGTQSEQQKMMLWMMPVVFAVIFYNMASGLVLYWFVNSLLMMITQWKVSK
jgi:YidC/Oxa1 family membrane protein insertase